MQPFDDQLGTEVIAASKDRVVLRLELTDRHLQGYGIVHGGVYCTLAETAASVGAALWASSHGAGAVGLSNHTDFVRAMRTGVIEAVAEPLQRGRSMQLWEVRMTDGDGRLAAHAKVRLFNVRGDHAIAPTPPPVAET